ncbi:prepilin-type N-terminal cleavage/methylation domain-containing protein [Campylobacter sp. RM15925]|uniref:prepilin-type N-terminal cleavage/methylation domain-containing protein n=1 Tax=Campylobacter sp. RM15925 TaxID=1705724 RepID=UPI001B8B3E91|nr:prepilin-type N-terminal cleavage/methylation domain-containing protein [Campylobacter sp. RM15925]
MKHAFTMIELVFVIVVIGILAGIAAPRLFATRDDAIIAKARSDIASIKSAVVNARNTNMLRGQFTYPALETASAGDKLFDNVLSGGIKKKASGATSGWDKNGNNYTFTLAGQSVTFAYNQTDGSFSCANDANGKALCEQLSE